MLKTDDFPPQHLETLTEQINNWLGDMIRSGQLRLEHWDSESSTTSGSLELGEHFLMAFLDDRKIRARDSLDQDLGQLVTSTGRRHHQLKYKKRAVAYARSLVDQDETLCQLFATKLAPKVDSAIAWLDAREDQIPEFVESSWRVRLVTIPTFHTHVFLIQRVEEDGSEVPDAESYIFVVSAPPWMDDLPKEKLLRTREFLLAFQSKAPILGVRGKNDVTERENRI